MRTLRIATSLAALLVALLALPAAAQSSFTVSASAPSTAEPGASAAVTIRIEGQIAALPSFIYDVEGGELVGVLAPTPVAAGVAEGTAFITRATPGAARLHVSFAGQRLATAEVRFAAPATIRVETLLDAGPNAAARTWRYEVVSPAGTVVATLQVNTSGDAPIGSAVSAPLPPGIYAVRQVLGNDTALTCTGDAFYAVASPAGAVQVVDTTVGPATVRFTIRPCPALPADVEVIIPVDTILPGAGSGIVGEPAIEPPFSDVAGVRQPGPGVLPPAAGNSAAPGAAAPGILPLVVSGTLLLLTGSGTLLLAARRSRPSV